MGPYEKKKGKKMGGEEGPPFYYSLSMDKKWKFNACFLSKEKKKRTET